MKFKKRTLDQLAQLICGNSKPEEPCNFVYRSSSYLTRFFQECETDYAHDGSTRDWWVSQTLEQILADPWPNPHTPPQAFCRVISTLMDQSDAKDEPTDRPAALAKLNLALTREGFEAFYAEDRRCYLRHVATSTVVQETPNPHRPFSAAEQKRKEQLVAWLDQASEDELINELLLPLFRQLGYQRITTAGHKDKALEYGKDIWMRYVLPTLHVIYFGIQAKKDKLDAAGMRKDGNQNVAEVYNQVQMMLGHEIFDPETNRRVLVDHALIVAGGEITKQARNWIGNKLDANKRSQIMFMDRDDIVNLYVVTNLPLPAEKTEPEDELPF